MSLDTTKTIKKLNIGSSPMTFGAGISDVTLNLTNLTAQATVIGSKNVSFTLVPTAGHTLPTSISFSSGITDGTYDNTTGAVTFTATTSASESITAAGV